MTTQYSIKYVRKIEQIRNVLKALRGVSCWTFVNCEIHEYTIKVYDYYDASIRYQ